jgi:hypothetical protein
MFNGAVNLVLARDPLLVENAWIRKRTNIADGWRHFAPQLTESFSLGNHMTVLSPPYVQSLVTNLFPPTSNTFSLLDVSNFRG